MLIVFIIILNDFFSGKSKTESTKSIKKIPPSPEIQKIMREKLDIEYRFYEFIKDKFEQLKNDLGL